MSEPALGASEGQGNHPHGDDAASLANSSDSASREPSPTASRDPQIPPDGSERPVRQQLKKTSIAAPEGTSTNSEKAKADDAISETGSIATDLDKSDKDAEVSSARGRPRRKRSFEELGADNADERTETSVSKHLRKRSRESEDAESGNGDGEEALSRTHSPDKSDLKQATDSASAKELTENDSIASEQPITPPADPPNSIPGDDMVISPQNKRSRDQFVKDHAPTPESSKAEGDAGSSTVAPEPIKDAFTISRAFGDEPDSKRPREGLTSQSEEEKSASPEKVDKSLPQSPGKTSATNVAQISSTSGFANTSSKSPFAALGSPKSSSANEQTSSSAFSSSGFASFASSAQSPFGAINKLESSNKEAAASSGFGALGVGVPSPFASATPSAFGSQSSGFAKLANGFGAPSNFGSGKPLSSFATPGSAGIIGASNKGPKPIGASTEVEDEDDDGEGDSGNDAQENGEPLFASTEDDEKDSRFYEQDLETGEENEETIFASRAKLYVSQDKQWKERGVGVFKLNVAHGDSSDGDDTSQRKKTARFIMRADGSHRVVLNSPVKKQITIEDPTGGGPPKGKTAIFLGFVDDRPTMMQIKVRSHVQTAELHSVVTSLQETL